MNCKICTISSRDGSWYVAIDKATLGPHFLQSLALQVAAATALDFYRKGERTKLRIEVPSHATVEHCVCPDLNNGTPCAFR
jgi:hypothetical protein